MTKKGALLVPVGFFSKKNVKKMIAAYKSKLLQATKKNLSETFRRDWKKNATTFSGVLVFFGSL